MQKFEKLSSSNPPKLHLESTETTDGSIIDKTFCQFFFCVFNDLVIFASFGDGLSFSKYVISAVDICNILETLDINKGAGPEDIPPILKNTAPCILAPYLAIHFRSLLVAGIFPALLKYSFVEPIFTKGDKVDIINYRPITLAKLFEKITQEHLYFYLSKYKEKEQLGFINVHSTISNLFMIGCSTMTNLFMFLESIMSSF